MHIITTVPDVLKYLPGLLSVVPNKPTHGVLANVYVETVTDGYREGVLFRATNLSGFLEAFVSCEVKEAGSICIPAKLFSNILVAQNSNKKILKTLELSSDANNLISIKTSNSSQTLQGMSGEEMPLIPRLEPTNNIVVNGVQFINKSSLLTKYCSKDVTKLALLTINLSQGKLTASDGHKVAFSEISTTEFDTTVSIYPAMIDTLRKLNLVKNLEDQECENITLRVESAQFSFVSIEFQNWKLTWRTGESDLDFSSISISGKTTTVVVDRKELVSKLKAAIVCSNQKITGLWLHSQAGRLYLIAVNSKDSLETDDITDPASFLLKAENLLSVVESLKVPTVKLVLPLNADSNLMGVEVDGVNVCLSGKNKDDNANDILSNFIEKTQFVSTRDVINKIYQEEIEAKLEPLTSKRQQVIATLEPTAVTTEPTLDARLQDVIN
ncbi:MAG: hypothetical protein ACKPA7_06985, partial [Sphaerospermopsis kisseleviana]